MAKNNCKVCGGPSLTEYCFRHKPREPLRRSGGIRRKDLPLIDRSAGAEAMWQFFLTIWNTRPHRCVETGKWLGDEPKWTFFHHLLHKAPYPEYEYDEWNIALVHPDVHTLAHSNLDAVPKVKALTELAWKEHISS